MNANQIAHIHLEWKELSGVLGGATRLKLQQEMTSPNDWDLGLTAVANKLHLVRIKSKATMFL